MAQGKIEDIQVLRAIAILLVLAQHLILPAVLFRAAPEGLQMPFWSGVALFFVISGYVVTASLLNRPVSPLGFLIRRAFRLWPAMVCFLVFSGVVCFLIWALPVPEWGKQQIAGSLDTFIREAIAILAGVLTITGQTSRLTHGAMWSLSVEFQFYAAYALLLFALWILRLPLRAVALWSAVALYLACLTVRLGGPPVLNMAPAGLSYLVRLSFDYLFLGVIGAAGLRPLMSGARWRFGPLIALLLIAASQIALLFVPAFAPVHALSTTAQRFAVPFAGLCFLALVMLASVDTAFRGQGGRPYRFFVWTGELSYSIYLFHLPVFGLFWLGMAVLYPAHFQSGDPGIKQMLVSVPLTYALAWLVYSYVEMPMNRRGAKLAASLERKRPVAV